MRTRQLVGLGLGLGLCAPAWGKQVAVVVGVSKYANLPDELALPTARDDARKLARFLEDEGGYEVHVLLDGVATKDGLEKLLLDTVAPNMSSGDTLLWAFVGHGIGGDFDDPYFLLYDSQLGDPDNTAIRLREFGPELVRRAPAVDLVLITDAAHAGQANGIAMIGPSAKSWPDLLGSSFLLSAAAPKEVAPAGMFVNLLVDGLRGGADANRDGFVTASEIHRHLLVKVAEASGDTVHPAEAGSYDPGMRISTASAAPPVVDTRPAEPVSTVPTKPVKAPKASGRGYGGPLSYSLMGVGLAGVGFGLYEYSVGKGLCTPNAAPETGITCPDTEEFNRANTLSQVGYWAGGALIAGGFGVGFVPLSGGGRLTLGARF